MTRFTCALASATTATVILLIFVLFDSMRSSFVSAVVVDPMTITLLPPHAGSNCRTVFVPLFPSLPNSSRIASFSGDGKSRRHLRISDASLPNARMDLHDDLLITGYYTTRLWIGSPPQKFALIVDTGSTVTYVPCSTCEHCGKHQDPKFDPDSSSTYRSVKCNIDCTCDNDRKQCIYGRQYAEMSSSSGVLGEDIVSFGNQSELSPQRATFGCENSESGDIYTQRADGIMGLGRGDLSLIDQLVDRGVISDSFSLCYGGMDVGGGAMVLGGISPPYGMVYAYSDPIRSPYYNVDLKELHVAGKRLPLNPSIFDGKHGTVLDSGTTYAYIPEEVFLVFKDAIMKELHSVKQIRGPDPKYKDICFSGAGSDVSELPETFPSVEMVFGRAHRLSLSPENYLFRVRGAYCLGIFQNAKEPTTILGGIIVRNTFVMYDREHDKIGFLKTNCSDLWARLNSSGVLPSTPDKYHPSPYTSPPAPLGPPPYHISPGSKVGSIIFYMSLNIMYSKLEPHITELIELIAMELQVNGSQVSLLDFISEGNGSLTIWSITPPEPAEYMSKETASDIIALIAEDEIHLPRSFGKHRISNWYIESAPNRTWWQNYRNVVIGIILVLVFGFLAFTTRWLWRYRQQTNIRYRPIGSIFPELELQTM
ncbi:hypothetical protein L1987_24498 [Smallanthus sonchifolius]|uniref:Uncharacterized protein n=1 Tax=Smallanthus sonchifolius TaxID=185202 RepID=A0ACB9IKM4_9ASTR|nr:hypothetical protein L1987_24498 [Smallanthus sonchifolius]